MITDPSWFYSSIAQASAAIVGLMGAVLVARMMDHLAQIRDEHEKLVVQVQQKWSNVNGFKSQIENLRGYFEAQIKLDQTDIDRGTSARQETGYQSFGMSTSLARTVDPKIHILDMQNGLEATKILLEAIPTLTGVLIEADIRAHALTLRNASNTITTDANAKNMGTSHAAELEWLAEKIHALKARLVPFSVVLDRPCPPD